MLLWLLVCPQAPAAESTLAVAAAARAIAYPGKQTATDGAEGRGELLSFAPHARPFDERVKVFRQASTRATRYYTTYSRDIEPTPNALHTFPVIEYS